MSDHKTIHRIQKKKGEYTIIHKGFLNDDRLSWKAKGLMAYMLSMPDDWTFYRDELCKHAKDGRDATIGGLDELKKYGYFRRERVKNKNGKFDWVQSLYEEPVTENPSVEPLPEKPATEKPATEKPATENPTLLINKELINDELNNDITSKDNTSLSAPSLPYEEIVSYLNEKTGDRVSNYRANGKKTQSLIRARMKEGFTVDDFKTVIDKRCQRWLYDKKMVEYLRPITLFGTNFESYLNAPWQGGNMNATIKPSDRLAEEYDFNKFNTM